MDGFKFEPLKDVKRSIIVDTDIGPDCDDVGALVVLCTLARKYDIPVMGVVNCTSNPYGCGAIDVVCRFCGYDDIRVGAFGGEGFLCNDDAKAYNKFISEKFNTKYQPVGTQKPEEAVSMYRKLLSSAEDKSVIIVTIGPLNTVSALLASKGDDISPKDGITLVNEKVYAVVTMAGCTEGRKREYNIVCDGEASAYFIENLPVPLIYSGVEIGSLIDSGFDPENPPADWENNPVFISYKLYSKFRNFSPCQNKSYDLTAVQFAFEGEGEFYKLSAPGKMMVFKEEKYATEFVFSPEGKSFYMDNACPIEKISNEFSSMLENAGMI